MATAIVTEQLDGSFVLRFPYNAWVIDRIKAVIPSHGRSYDPGARVWTVYSAWISEAVGILEDAFETVTMHRNAQRAESARMSGSVGNNYYADLHLLPTAPPELVRDAYRCLAKLYHPDRGGSTAAMQRINAAKDHLAAMGVFGNAA